MEFERQNWLLAAVRLYMGICVPAQCSKDDLEQLINGLLGNSKEKMDPNLQLIQLTNCESVDKWTLGQLSMVILFILFPFVLICYGKIFGSRNENVNLEFVNQQRVGPMANLVHVLTMISIVYYHTYLFTKKSPMQQSLPLLELFQQLTPAQILIYGWPLFEALIIVNSFTMSYRFFNAYLKTNNSQNINQRSYFTKICHFCRTILSELINRWMSLALILIVFFLLSPYFRGPLSGIIIDNEKKQCKTSWWKVLLFQSNQNEHFHQMGCLPHTWIISVEIQLFLLLIPTILLLIYILRPKLISAFLFTIIFNVINVLAMFVFYYHYGSEKIDRLRNIIVSEEQFVEDIFQWSTMTWFYLGPSVIGLTLGYLHALNMIQLTNKAKTILWFLFILIGNFLIFLVKSDILWSSLILGTFYFFWSIWIAIPIIVEQSNVEEQNDDNSLIGRIAPLSNCCYLIHYLVIVFRDSNRRQPLLFNNFNMFQEFLLNLTISLAISWIIQHAFIGFVLLIKTICNLVKSPGKRQQKKKSTKQNNKNSDDIDRDQEIDSNLIQYELK